MKRSLLKTVAGILFFAIVAMGDVDKHYIDDFPDHFSSVKELKEKLEFSEEWLSLTVDGKQFIISHVVPPQAGSSLDRITCWFNDVHLGRVVSVWDVRLTETGPVTITIDKDSSTLTVIATANTSFKGKVLASVILSALGP